jgi:hypothetical protein
MIKIDIPMPEKCMDCPCSYWIRSGEYEDMLLCNALEFKKKANHIQMRECLVDEYSTRRPKRCPILGEV